MFPAAAAIVAVTVGITLVLGAQDPQPGSAHGGNPSVVSPSPKPPVSSGPPHLLEMGRHYDVANVFGSTYVPGSAGPSTLVLYVHRLRVADGQTGKLIPDRQIADHGFTPYPHTDQIEVLKDKATYAVPVRPTATFVINRCSGFANGDTLSLTAHHVTAAQFLHSFEKVATVMKLDERGWLISAQTDGGC